MPVTLIKPQIERVLRQTILKDLAQGRKDFDKPHTEAVVFWMKYLLTHIKSTKQLDSQVLITASYAHDWGYQGLFVNKNSNSLQDIKAMKKLHMTRGAVMIERLLHQKLGRYFTQQQILRTAHLVLFHDQVKKLHDEDELLLMEADTLGMLDTDFITPTFSKKDNLKFIKQGIKGLRFPHFIHQEAKDLAIKLIDKRQQLS